MEMTTTQTTTAPVSDLARLRREQAADEARLVELLREQANAWAAIDGRDAPEHERLLVRAREPALRREMLEVRALLAERAPTIRRLKDAERARLRAEFRERKRPLVARLARALGAAASVSDELADLEHAEALACGSCERLSWHELDPESPMVASRLAAWRRFAQTEGFGV